MKKIIQKWLGITDIKDDVKELVRCINKVSYDYSHDRCDDYQTMYKFRPKSYNKGRRKEYWNERFMNLED